MQFLVNNCSTFTQKLVYGQFRYRGLLSTFLVIYIYIVYLRDNKLYLSGVLYRQADSSCNWQWWLDKHNSYYQHRLIGNVMPYLHTVSIIIFITTGLLEEQFNNNSSYSYFVNLQLAKQGSRVALLMQYYSVLRARQVREIILIQTITHMCLHQLTNVRCTQVYLTQSFLCVSSIAVNCINGIVIFIP